MNDKIDNRLEELKKEFADGQALLAETEQKKNNLEQTLLRIAGAIQALEELKAEEPPKNK